MKRIVKFTQSKRNWQVHLPMAMLEETGLKEAEYIKIQNKGESIVISKAKKED